MASLSEVFGIARDIPANYVARGTVDGAFIDSLTREKHVVVYGSSKQGKTCLRKYNLSDHEHTVVTCSNKWSLSLLHTAILKSVGYTVAATETFTESGVRKISASFTGKVGIPGVGEIGGSVGGEEGGDTQRATTTEPLELDPEDVNDVIAAMEACGAPLYVVLEDFHYLGDEAQNDFSVSLKAFHENSNYCFIVVGVWLDENRLIELNGDLSGRVIAVDADEWSEVELRSVLEKGQDLLNVDFDARLAGDIIKGCSESVSVLQEACYRACEAGGVLVTQKDRKTIGADLAAADLIKAVVDEQSARYNAFISNFADGFSQTDLEMYRWLLYPVLNSEAGGLERGLRLTDINRTLREVHPKGGELNPGNVTQALKSSASLQVQKNIKPLVLDYDQSARRLSVVDRGFLIWLSYQPKDELLETAGIQSSDGSAVA
jgi:hypothetical protein